MATKNVNNVVIEGAVIFSRNFSGKENLPNNPKGRRNFCLELPGELAAEMEDEGWNVKYNRNDIPYLPVAVSYDKYPPKIYKITSRGKTLLSEDLVGGLDEDEFENVDLIIRPYCWNVNGNTGVKAYVKDMYVTIKENALTSKYGD